MSDSGITDDDCFKSDVMNNLTKKSATQSPSIDSPPSICKGSNGSSSPLLDMTPLPAEDLSICPYCNKNYRKPRVLDCLHSLCEDCIIAQLDGRVDNKKDSLISTTDFELEQTNNQIRPTPPGVIRCPICYQESHVGNDVRFVNFMLLDFIRLRDADHNTSDNGDRICRACKGEQPAVANCRHCCSDICKNCVQAHRDMKMFDGHKVVLFTEVDAEPQTNGISSTPLDVALCIHHQFQYEYICTSCDELICQQCYLEHKTHNCSPLNDEVFQYYSSKLKALTEQVENKGTQTTEARSLIPERLTDLHSAHERCKAKIESAFEFYAKILEETKQKVFTDLEHKKDEQEDHFNNLYQQIDLQTARLQDAVAFTNRLLEKGTVVELCASRKKVWQQLQNLIHGMPEVNAEIDMDFAIPKEQDFRAKFEQIVGNVECRVISVPNKDEKILSTLNTAQNGSGDPVYSIARVPSSARGWDSNELTNSLSSLQFNNTESARPPGAIGMERRQTRGSVASNLGTMMDPIFNSQPLVPSPPNPIVANNDIYGLNRLNETSVNVLNSVPNRMNSNFNPLTPSAVNFGKNQAIDPFVQNKSWTNFNPPNTTPQFDMDIMARQRSIDPRFAGQPDFGLPNFDIFSSNRSSQCTTPSFDSMNFANPNMMVDNKNMGFMGPLGMGRMPNTIEMSLHTTFGSSTGGIDMLSTPQGICLGLDDEIVVADTNNHRCVVFNTGGKLLRQFGCGPGTEDGSLYYPRKLVSIISGRDCRFIVLDRGNTTGSPNRFQMYNANGEFLSRLHPIPSTPSDQINTFTWHKDTAHLVTVDCKSNVVVFDVSESPIIKPIAIFSVSTHVQEASDVAIYKNHYFITDYKTHSIVVYNIEGKFVHKFGNINITPFPIGIDISKSGDILVGDSHGNHYHIVVFNSNGKPQQDYKCMSLKVSRCTGLKITTEGYIVTMSRQTNTVLVFNTLYMPPLPPLV